MGPHVANVFDPLSWKVESRALTLEVMRIVLATGLFAIGVELPQSYIVRHFKSLLVMVVPTMAAGWLVCAGELYAFLLYSAIDSLLRLSLCASFISEIGFHVGAGHLCLSDAHRSGHLCRHRRLAFHFIYECISNSRCSVGGKFAVQHVPANLRHLILAESASNDGLAYPFLTISLYLTTESYGPAFRDWFLVGCLCTLRPLSSPTISSFTTHPFFFFGKTRPSHFWRGHWCYHR